jgi:NADH-quinone oxidoreductase subunit D
MYSWREREQVLDMMERLSGGRVSHAVNLIGGVRIDLDEAQRATLQAQLAALDGQVRELLGVIENEPTFKARTQAVGYLSPEQIRRYCVVGPVARASGVDVDLRRDLPRLPYTQLDFKVITHTSGDVWARSLVRLLEVVESLRLCQQILDKLPAGPVAVTAKRRAPSGEVVSRSEAPRGEVLYYIRSDGSDKPARLKIRTPTLTTLVTLPEQLRDITVADISVVLSGVDLCIACADR